MNLFIFLFVFKLLNQFPIEVRPYVSAILTFLAFTYYICSCYKEGSKNG